MGRKRSKPNDPTPSNGARWLLFMPSIPAKPASARVKIWRRLQAIGAIGLRGSVYVLPNRDECAELLGGVTGGVGELGGKPSLGGGGSPEGAPEEETGRGFTGG